MSTFTQVEVTNTTSRPGRLLVVDLGDVGDLDRVVARLPGGRRRARRRCRSGRCAGSCSTACAPRRRSPRTARPPAVTRKKAPRNRKSQAGQTLFMTRISLPVVARWWWDSSSYSPVTSAVPRCGSDESSEGPHGPRKMPPPVAYSAACQPGSCFDRGPGERRVHVRRLGLVVIALGLAFRIWCAGRFVVLLRRPRLPLRRHQRPADLALRRPQLRRPPDAGGLAGHQGPGHLGAVPLEGLGRLPRRWCS